MNNIEPLLEGIPGVASAAVNGGKERQINVIVDPAKAQARGITAERRRRGGRAVERAACPRASSSRKAFDANVYTNAVPSASRTSATRSVKVVGGTPVYIRDVARVEDGGSPPTQAVSVNGENAHLPERAPRPRRQHARDRRRGASKVVDGPAADLPPGMKVEAVFDESTYVRTAYQGLQAARFFRRSCSSRSSSCCSSRARAARSSSRSRSRCRSPSP